MKDVYLVDACRTPFGSFGGALSAVPATSMAAHLIKSLLERHNLSGDQVNEVILGQVLSTGVGHGAARQAMLNAGVPDSVPAMSINKVCGSGLKAIMLGADSIILDRAETVMAGGMENMSLAPYMVPGARFGLRMGPGKMVDLLLHDALLDPFSGRHVGELTEELIAEYGFSREEQDEYAEKSYRRAQQASESGRFADEIVPYVISSRKGDVTVADDEEPFKVSFDKIAGLRSVFKKDGTITAANASTINDGAAVVMLASEEAVEKNGLQPIAKIVATSTHSIKPERFAEAPVAAIEKVCQSAAIKIEDVGLFEINEAFSAVPLMPIKTLGLDPDKVNVNGGAVSIGHPLGASGARLVTTLVKEMQIRQERYGLATLCIGGGEAVAAVFEKV